MVLLLGEVVERVRAGRQELVAFKKRALYAFVRQAVVGPMVAAPAAQGEDPPHAIVGMGWVGLEPRDHWHRQRDHRPVPGQRVDKPRHETDEHRADVDGRLNQDLNYLAVGHVDLSKARACYRKCPPAESPRHQIRPGTACRLFPWLNVSEWLGWKCLRGKGSNMKRKRRRISE